MYNKLKTLFLIFIFHKRGFKLGRKLNGILLLLRLNYNTRYNLITKFKIIKRPLSFYHRFKIYNKIVNGGGDILDMSKGYNIFSISHLPNVEEFLEILHNLYEEKLNNKYYKEKILSHKLNFNLLEESDYQKHPKINDFLLNDFFINIATKYFKSLPIIAAVEFWVSFNNRDIIQSQKWHIDGEDKRQVKFFISIIDINIENGPTHFVDKTNSKNILKKFGNKEKYLSIRSGDLSPRIPDNLIDKNSIITGLLKKYECLALDTCKCLHMGSRIEDLSKHRLVLMVQFVPANCHREPALSYPPIQLSKKLNSKINKLVLDI